MTKKPDRVLNILLGIFTTAATVVIGYTFYAIILYVQTHTVIIDHWWGWGF